MYLGNVRNLSWSFQVGLNALLALVEEPELSPLVGVDDSKDLGDSLADVMNAGELGVGATGDLGGPELDQLPFTSVSMPAFLPVFCVRRHTT